MNGIGDTLANGLLSNPKLIPFYVIGLWFLVIKPLFSNSNNDDSES